MGIETNEATRAPRPAAGDGPESGSIASAAQALVIGGEPFSEPRTWARLLAYMGHWALMGFGYWVIEQKSSGDFVGEVGQADFQRDVAPAMKGSPKIGFALVPQFHGNGYATQSARAVLAWADAHLRFRGASV